MVQGAQAPWRSGPVPRTAIALSIANARPAHRASCGAQRHGTGRSGPMPRTAITLSIANARPARRASCGAQRHSTGHSAPVPRTARELSIGMAPYPQSLMWGVNRQAGTSPGVAYATAHKAPYHGCAQPYVRPRFFFSSLIYPATSFHIAARHSRFRRRFLFLCQAFYMCQKKDAPRPANASCVLHIFCKIRSQKRGLGENFINFILPSLVDPTRPHFSLCLTHITPAPTLVYVVRGICI